MAITRSTARIRRYAGWCWLIALVLPFLVLCPAFAMAGWLRYGDSLIGMPLMIVASVLSSCALSAWFQALILKPALQVLLQDRLP